MSDMGLGRVKTPMFNLRVEIPSRFRKFENQKCLRPLLREDDRENNSAHSWLVHVFTQPGSFASILACPRHVRSGGNLGSAGGRFCQLKASVRTGFFLNAGDTARFKARRRKRPAFFYDHT